MLGTGFFLLITIDFVGIITHTNNITSKTITVLSILTEISNKLSVSCESTTMLYMKKAEALSSLMMVEGLSQPENV